MANSTIHHSLVPEQSTGLDRQTFRRLRQLMTRDKLNWTEFLRRAVQAYDLMYSRDD